MIGIGCLARPSLKIPRLVVVAAMALAGCSAQNDASLSTSSVTKTNVTASAAPARPVSTGPAKVALLLPLTATGGTAVIAKGLKQAAELALFPYDRPTIELMVKDDGGTPDGAAKAAQEALAEGAEVILGPLFAHSVKAVAAVATPQGVPVVAFSNDATVAGPGVHLMSFQVHQDVERIVSFAASKGKKRFAALISDDLMGKRAEEAFRAAVAQAGGSVGPVQIYESGASNGMVQPVQRLVDAMNLAEEVGQPVDAVFVPGNPEVLAGLGPLLAHAGIDTVKVKLIGTSGWDSPMVSRDATFVGGWYPAPDPRGWKDFTERFTKTFGTPPPRIASLSHDAVGVAIALSTSTGGQRYTPATLSRASGFNGSDGNVRFLASGAAERGLAVLEVQKFGVTVIDAAPNGDPATASPVVAPADPVVLAQASQPKPVKASRTASNRELKMKEPAARIAPLNEQKQDPKQQDTN
jgi:branched-chain amino acid transport system substrate-binding protein